MTAEVGEAISAAGGWIIDHTLFSNIAITVRFSLPAGNRDQWRRLIVAAGVALDDASLAELLPATGEGPVPDEEIVASLNLTFIHDEPDLRRLVPAVPG